MSSVNIPMTAGSFIAKDTVVPMSSSAWLHTAYDDYPYYPQAILQFTVPSWLKNRKVTKVDLYFYIRPAQGYQFACNGLKLAPLLIGNYLDSLTYSNEKSLGTPAEYATIEPIYTGPGATSYPAWRVLTVTSFFMSNIYDNTYFTLKIRSYPGYGINNYAEIGGMGSGYEAYLKVEYETVDQDAPTPSYPNNVFIPENTDFQFVWSWNSATSAIQTAVQLEYKLQSALNWTVVSLTQTGHSYKLTGGLSIGAYVWRIKGTNDASETSDYSTEAEFNVVGKPSAPIINTPANKALTEITWQSTDQNSFDITLTDSNGNVLIDEVVGSVASSYKPNMFLKGTYTVGIRYRNSTGQSSEWSYKVFAITAAGPTKPTMTLYVDGSKVYVNFSPASGVDYYLIRQPEGGKEELAQDPKIVSLGRFEDTTYKFFVPYRYVLRAYAGAGYTDSDPVLIKHGIYAIVLDADGEELILDKSTETFLPYSEDATDETAIYNVIGRDYPIAEHGAYDNWQFSSVLFVTEEQKEKLRAMKKKNEIYYRDYSGRGFPVVIQSVNFARWKNVGYTATINFVRVSGEELVINV